MKKKRGIFVAGVSLVLALAVYLFITGFGRPALAGLSVDSNTATTVFVDGKEVGQTPYNGTFPPKEVVVSLGNYETRVALQPEIKTIIQRDFTEGQVSSGEIISFEKTGEAGATIALVTNPDGAKVSLDGSMKGFTPVNIDASPGTHQLHIEA